MDRRVVRTGLISALAVLVLLALAGLAWMYSGVYNVAASQPHTAVTRWVLETVMERSVRERAEGIQVPVLEDSALLADGFHHFAEMCVTCHGAPGVERSEIGRGLTPTPPALSDAAPEWTDAEIYWIVGHGIKMSGMPAFGVTHSERELWGIVAFVRRLPGMSAAEYQAHVESDSERQDQTAGDHGHGHDHEH